MIQDKSLLEHEVLLKVHEHFKNQSILSKSSFHEIFYDAVAFYDEKEVKTAEKDSLSCVNCGKKGFLRSKGYRSMVDGSTWKRYSCTSCNNSTYVNDLGEVRKPESSEKLASHLTKKAEVVKTSDSFVCADCSKAFNSHQGLSMHVRRVHKGFNPKKKPSGIPGEKPFDKTPSFTPKYACDVSGCSFIAFNKRSLGIHKGHSHKPSVVKKKPLSYEESKLAEAKKLKADEERMQAWRLNSEPEKPKPDPCIYCQQIVDLENSDICSRCHDGLEQFSKEKNCMEE